MLWAKGCQASYPVPVTGLVMLWARHCQASYPVQGQVLFIYIEIFTRDNADECMY